MIHIPDQSRRYRGSDYDPAKDNARLDNQLGRVWGCMQDGQWRTLDEIAAITKDPQASISAQLRHLRKPRFGSYVINKRNRGNREHGLFEYQLQPPVPRVEVQKDFFQSGVQESKVD